MADLPTLQKAIDEKNIDTRKLNSEQLQALDQAFKSGELTGYDSIKDYSRIINLGAAAVAQQKQKRLEGFESPTGITRGDFVLAGSAAGSFIPFYKDAPKLVDAFTRAGFKDVYGVDTRFAPMGEIYKKRFTVLGDALKKLPNVRGPAGLPIRAFSNLAGMVDNTIDFFTKLGGRVTGVGRAVKGKRPFSDIRFEPGYGATQVLATSAKSYLGGAAGSFGGSAAFDIASLGSDFVGATSQDLANLTNNDIRRLPFAQRLLYNGLTEAYNDLLWAGGATALIPLVKFAGRNMVKNSLGLNSEQSKEIAKAYERTGIKPTVAALIPGEGAFQGFFKKFFSTIGVYPLVSGPLAKVNKELSTRLTQEEFLKTVDNLNMAPASNISIMNYAGINQMRKEWERVWKAIDTEYGAVRETIDQIGNPAFIPTQNIKQSTTQLLDNLKREYPESAYIFTDLEKGARALTEVDDPMIQYVKLLNDVTNRSDRIRMSDWLGLSRAQTAAYTGSKFKNVKSTLLNVRNAMELDLNSLKTANSKEALKQGVFKTEYDQILKEQGPEAAEAFIDKQVRTADVAFNRLKEANAFYSLVLRPFQKDRIVSQLRSADSKLFADKGIEMIGTASIYPDEVFDKVIRRVLASDSPAAVKQLKQILGVTRSSYKILDDAGKVTRTVNIPKSKESQEVYDRYVREFFWDSWNNATEFPLRDFRSISTQAAAAKAAAQGFVRKRPFQMDDITEQRIRAKTKTNETLDVTEIDARVFTQSDIANLNEGIIRNHDFGNVDIEKFAKNIGIDSKQGRDKIREIFGGGASGEKALQRIDDIIKIKQSLDGVTYRDPSTFVQRAVTLQAGSSRAISASATAAAFGIGSTLKLILGARLLGGQLLVNPKVGESLMELNKYERFMTGNNALSPRLTPQISSTFVRFINSLMEAEGDDFRVDPNNIDFEEIQNKIRSLDPNLPLNNSFDFGSMPKFTRDRIYPEFEIAKNLPNEVAQAGDDYLQGSNLIALSDEQFNQVANSEPMVQATEPAAMVPPTEPTAMTMGQTPQATGQEQAQQFAALFPQDTLGQAVAARGLKEGGLVEDAYAQADEVLNG